MLFKTVAAAAVSLLALPSALAQNASDSGLLTNVTIFSPPANYTIPRTLYARTLLLNQNCETDNVLLATWENYREDNNTFPYLPIYASTDGGASWSERAKVYDQANGWGLRYQPFLYELHAPIANFSAGTILLSMNSIPDDLSETQIDMYYSTDKGYSFHFLSHIAHGGEALPNNGLTPVWEPFILQYNDQVIVYYSDQRDPEAGQKLVHQVSSDLVNWGPVVDDVKYSTYDWRPGMPVISQLPLGNWIYTYEFYGAVEADFAVYYKISNDPLNFNASVGRPIIASDGTIPVSSPYNVWTPVGGPLGTIVVSDGTHPEVFVSHDLANGAYWTKVPTPEGVSYTRNLRVLPDESKILITGGGVLGGENNSVTTSSINITPNAPVPGAGPQCNTPSYKARL